MTFLLRRFLGGAGGDDIPALVAAFGSKVNDIIGDLDDIRIALDDDDGIPAVNERMQDFDKLVHVGEMKPSRANGLGIKTQ